MASAIKWVNSKSAVQRAVSMVMDSLHPLFARTADKVTCQLDSTHSISARIVKEDKDKWVELTYVTSSALEEQGSAVAVYHSEDTSSSSVLKEIVEIVRNYNEEYREGRKTYT